MLHRSHDRSGQRFCDSGVRVCGTAFAACLACLAAAGEQPPESLFLRVRVLECRPDDQPVQLGLAVFAKPHQTVAKAFVHAREGLQRVPAGYGDAFPWTDAEVDGRFRAGDVSPWIDLAGELRRNKERQEPAGPGPQWLHDPAVGFETRVVTLSFRRPQAGPIIKAATDAGNLDSVRIRLEWARTAAAAAAEYFVEAGSESGQIVLLAPPQAFSGVRPDPRLIKTYADVIRDLNRSLDAVGFGPQRPHPPFELSGRIHGGQWYPLLDRETLREFLGIGSRFSLQTVGVVPDVACPEAFGRRDAPPGMGVGFWDFSPVPDGRTERRPFEHDFVAAGRQLGRRIAAQARGLGEDGGPGPARIVKLGDEVGISPALEFPLYPAAREAFLEFLRASGRPPADFGWGSWDEYSEAPLLTAGAVTDSVSLRDGTMKARPLDEIERNPQAALLWYQFILFRQQAGAEMWGDFVRGVKTELKGEWTIMTESTNSGLVHKLDPFILSRSGAFDAILNEYTHKLWAPAHELPLRAEHQHSAAKFGRSQAGAMWFPERSSLLGRWNVAPEFHPAGVLQSGGSLLMRKIPHIHDYSLMNYPALFAAGQGAFLPAVARVFRLATTHGELLLRGATPADEPDAAIFLSHPSEAWAVRPVPGHGTLIYRLGYKGWFTERNMVAAALAFQQIPFNVLPDAELIRSLDRYRVLYVTDPHMERRAQTAVVDWVRAGGTLFMTAEAASRDEASQPCSLLDRLAGVEGAATPTVEPPVRFFEMSLHLYPTHGTLRWGDAELDVFGRRERLNVPPAEVLATYDDGSPAAIEFGVGKGRVLYVGTSLGACVARTADPSPRGEGDVRHDFRRFSEAGLATYCAPLDQARRQMLVLPGVDGRFFELNGEGLIMLVDYFEPRRTVDVGCRLRGAYTKALDEQGREWPVIADPARPGWSLIRNFPLETLAVLRLR